MTARQLLTEDQVVRLMDVVKRTCGLNGDGTDLLTAVISQKKGDIEEYLTSSMIPWLAHKLESLNALDKAIPNDLFKITDDFVDHVVKFFDSYFKRGKLSLTRHDFASQVEFVPYNGQEIFLLPSRAEQTASFRGNLKSFFEDELKFYLLSKIDKINELSPEINIQIGKELDFGAVFNEFCLKIVDFMDQIERFRVDLFNKDRFAIKADYCISIDKLSGKLDDALFKAIANNPGQKNDWFSFMALSGIKAEKAGNLDITREFLESHPFLVLDTKHFPNDVKYRILEALGNVDSELDGYIIDGEPEPALDFIALKFQANIDCVYTEPALDAIPLEPCYDQFLEKPWYAIFQDVISKTMHLLKPFAIMFARIEDMQFERVNFIMANCFGKDNLLGPVCVKKETTTDGQLGFKKDHDFIICAERDINNQDTDIVDEQGMFEVPRPVEHDEKDVIGYFEARELRNRNPKFTPENRPNLGYPISVDPNTADENGFHPISAVLRNGFVETSPTNKEGRPSVWRWQMKTLLENISENEVIINNVIAGKTKSGKWKVFKKIRANDVDDSELPKLQFQDALNAFKLDELMDHTKSSDIKPPLCYPLYIDSSTHDENGFYPVSITKKDKDSIEILPVDKAGIPRVWKWDIKTVGANINKKVKLPAKAVAQQTKGGKWNVYEKYRSLTRKVNSIWEDYIDKSPDDILLTNVYKKNPDVERARTALIELCIKIGSSKNGVILDPFARTALTAHAVLNVNKKHRTHKRFILIEPQSGQEEKLKLHLKHVIKSNTSTDKSTSEDDELILGIGCAYCYVRLERVEDTLRNLDFSTATERKKLYKDIDDYIPSHVFNVDTRESVCRFNLDKFASPFSYRFKISGEGGIVEKDVDVIETTNFLLGIRIQHATWMINGKTNYVVILGDRNGKSVLLVWRDLKELDLGQDKKFIESQVLARFKSDSILVNGKSFVKNATTIEEAVNRSIK